jgi:hypothetical protein
MKPRSSIENRRWCRIAKSAQPAPTLYSKSLTEKLAAHPEMTAR